MIGLTGASGQLGRLVIAALQAQGVTNVVALLRDPAKLAGAGIEARAFDYDRPEGHVAALAGIETLLLISSSEVGKRVAQHQAVIDAARAAGVGRIVYTSLLRADSSPISLAEEHLPTELAIKASGLDYTILRNGWYSENYAGQVAGALAHGALVGAAGEGRVSSASRADYAGAAAKVLTGTGHAGKTYELAGDEAWSFAELAATLSTLAGREIPWQPLDVPAYAKVLEGAGLPAPVALMIAGWDATVAEGSLASDDRSLSTLLGRPTTPIAETLRGLAAG